MILQLAFLLGGLTFVGAQLVQPPCWIQEISDQKFVGGGLEFVEVACLEATDIAGWNLDFYYDQRNGSGFVFDSASMTDATVFDTNDGISLFVFEQMFPKGGLALVDDDGNIVEFITFSGDFVASNGPAAGLEATNVGFSPFFHLPAGYSIQRAGVGCSRGDFEWEFPDLETLGEINIDQVFTCSLLSSSPSRSFVPTTISSHIPSMAPTSGCYFSCQQGLSSGDWTTSGLYDVCPTGPDGDNITVYCDQETAGGGWTLLLSYNHVGGTNNELVNGIIPTDPVAGYSHVKVDDIDGYGVGDIEALRFYCVTSAHNRTIHFVTSNPVVLSIAFDDDQTRNDPEFWNQEAELQSDHTAFLPNATDNVDRRTDGGLTQFPFWAAERFHWAVRGAFYRWECDDFPNDSDEDTLHLVWGRIRESPSSAPSESPSAKPVVASSVAPTVRPSPSPTSSLSAFPTEMPSSAPCFFSCQDGLDAGAWTESGLYQICPRQEGERITVYCDQETAEGGWTLLLSYNHSAGTNEELVEGTIPIDPISGYSHVNVDDIDGYTVGNIGAVRFYCETSSHQRIMHFVTSSLAIVSIAFDGDQSVNSPQAWNQRAELMSDHTAFLPNATGNVDQRIDGGFTQFPFWTAGNYHWAIRGAFFRWECDDFVNDADEATRHLVWVRIRR